MNWHNQVWSLTREEAHQSEKFTFTVFHDQNSNNGKKLITVQTQSYCSSRGPTEKPGASSYLLTPHDLCGAFNITSLFSWLNAQLV